MTKKPVSFLMGIVIFSGLPLLGWGITNVSGFLQNPYRFTHIIMMAVLTLLVVIFVPESGKSRGEGKKLVKKHKISLLFMQVIPLFIVFVSPYFDRHHILLLPDKVVIRILGLAMTLAGFTLMNWSVMVLGKQFSADVTIQDDHQLITSGPYRYIRHPRYLGIIIFIDLSFGHINDFRTDQCIYSYLAGSR